MTNSCYLLKTTIPYNESSIESILKTCADAISEITKIQDVAFRLNFAIQELVVNSLEHGYKKKIGEVSIAIFSEKDSIRLEVSDQGTGIDLTKLNIDNNISDLDEVSIRGWGLNVLKKIFTSMSITQNMPQGTKVSLVLLI